MLGGLLLNALKEFLGGMPGSGGLVANSTPPSPATNIGPPKSSS
jgi:hypothetical protein